MKTRFKTSTEENSIKQLLKNQNFRNNQNYVLGNKLNNKILYYILNKNTNYILGFNHNYKTQEISLNIINDLNILKLIFTILIYLYLLYFIYNFSYLIHFKYNFLLFLFFSFSLFIYLFKSFLLNFFSNSSVFINYINNLNKKYKIFKNKEKAIIYNNIIK